MKHVRSVNWFGILTQVDRIISKKHTLKVLVRDVEKTLKANLRNTRVFIAVGHEGSAKSGEPKMVRTVDTRSFADDFAALVVKRKNNVVVNQNLSVFCRRHRIKLAQRNLRSVFGSPIQYQGKVYGALILQNVKEMNAFDKEAKSAINMVAQRLAAGIANERLSQENCRLENEIKLSCLTDPLTNMPNRRFCDLILDMEFRRAKGYTRQLSLAMVTPDNHRSITSKYGRTAGDSLLLHVAATLKKNVRDTDFVGRFKDDEFLVLLPEAVNEAALNAAERVRDAFERTKFTLKRLGRKKVTLSIGVVTYPSSAETLIALLETAGKALKRAKQVGRNQVVAL